MSLRKHLLVFFIIPFFFVGFGIAYKPFDMLNLCNFGVLDPLVHVVLLGCILMGVLLVSRIVYFFVDKANRLNWWQDILWIFGEMFCSSFFLAIYISLFKHVEYFLGLGLAFQLAFAILIFPYAILCLIDALVIKVTEPKYSQDPENVIHFYDDSKHLKLVIAVASVLYIKADDNSVRINYIESGRLKEYILRTSMRKLEPTAEHFHLIRCQRSYYVNPSHVKVLRKDKDGFIFADLGLEDVKPIPVSKTYYDNLAAIL